MSKIDFNNGRNIDLDELIDKFGEKVSDISEKVSDFIQEIGENLSVVADEVAPDIENAKAEIKEHFINELIEFKNKISVTSFDGNCTLYEVEILTSEKMIECAKKHIVKGANMVVAYKGENNVYLTYANDGEFILDESNHYINIKPDELDTDVVNLFEEQDLIILQ